MVASAKCHIGLNCNIVLGALKVLMKICLHGAEPVNNNRGELLLPREIPILLLNIISLERDSESRCCLCSVLGSTGRIARRLRSITKIAKKNLQTSWNLCGIVINRNVSLKSLILCNKTLKPAINNNSLNNLCILNGEGLNIKGNLNVIHSKIALQNPKHRNTSSMPTQS